MGSGGAMVKGYWSEGQGFKPQQCQAVTLSTLGVSWLTPASLQAGACIYNVHVKNGFFVLKFVAYMQCIQFLSYILPGPPYRGWHGGVCCIDKSVLC